MTREPASTRERDLNDIRNLLALYSQSYDLGDAAGVAALFTEDGVLDTTAPTPDEGGRFTGHDEISEFVRFAVGYSAGRTRTSPALPIIEIDGETARMTSYAISTRDYGPPKIAGDLTHSELTTTGMYFDGLSRVDGTWRFTRRTYRHDASPDVLERVGRPLTAGE